MKIAIVLRVLAGLFLVAATILLILHFTCQYSAFWFSAANFCAIILNLIASIIYLKIQKAEKNKEQRNASDDNQNN